MSFLGFRSTSDGWRAIIGDGFTFENAHKVAYGLCKYITSRKKRPLRVIVSHDTRFMGDMFARQIANVFLSRGIRCDLVDRPIPTPLLSWCTKHYKYDIGIAVTASHNPYYYNGIKIRMPYGGPPNAKIIADIENAMPNSTIEVCTQKYPVTIIDPTEAYIRHVRQNIDLDSVDGKKIKIAVDCMHGTTSGLLSKIFDGIIEIIEIRSNPDPLFGNIPPEPKSETTSQLSRVIDKHDCGFGIAHDGDGDRIIAYDPDRGYISPHDLIVILSHYLATQKNKTGKIVVSVSTTTRIKSLAKMLNIEYIEVPVGFRNASAIMDESDVLIAGEENGGIGVGYFMPERDATFIAALLIEIVATTGISLGKYLENIEKTVGSYYYKRKDIPLRTTIDMQHFSSLRNIVVCNQIVDSISEVDGMKFEYSDGSWALIRPAGTEPLIRVYAESKDPQICSSIIEIISEQIEKYYTGGNILGYQNGV